MLFYKSRISHEIKLLQVDYKGKIVFRKRKVNTNRLDNWKIKTDKNNTATRQTNVIQYVS